MTLISMAVLPHEVAELDRAYGRTRKRATATPMNYPGNVPHELSRTPATADNSLGTGPLEGRGP